MCGGPCDGREGPQGRAQEGSCTAPLPSAYPYHRCPCYASLVLGINRGESCDPWQYVRRCSLAPAWRTPVRLRIATSFGTAPVSCAAVRPISGSAKVHRKTSPPPISIGPTSTPNAASTTLPSPTTAPHWRSTPAIL